jgi:O-antigen/teichoic acid export membrane protein
MREVVRGAAISFLVKGLGAVLGFAFNILLARTVGAHGAGIYFLALTVTTISSVIARMGLDNTVLRFVAAHAAVNDWATVKGVVKKSLTLVVVTSVFVMGIVLLIAPWLANTVFSKPELMLPIRWMALSIPLLSLIMIYAEMLRGLKRILHAEALQGLILPFFMFTGMYSTFVVFGEMSAEKVYVCAALISTISGFFIWHRESSKNIVLEVDFKWKKLFHSCLPLYSSSILNQAVIPWLPYFVLGMLSNQNDVGLFGMALRTAYLVSAVLVAMNSIAAPKIAALYKQNKLQELEQLMQRSTRLLVFVAIPVTLILVAFPGGVMSLFGSEFSGASNVLRVLVLGQLVNVLCGPVGFLLIMSGKEDLFHKSLMISSLLLLGLMIGLVPYYHAIGAAIASALAVVTNNLINLYFVRKHLKISLFK